MEPPKSINPKQWQACIDRWRRERFLAGAQWALMWEMSADRHKRSADVLFSVSLAAFKRDFARTVAEEVRPDKQPTSRTLCGEELADHLDVGMIRDYFLLIGYAIENLLKGYLLTLKPELVREENKLDRLVKTHDLVKLRSDCGVTTSPEEHELLQHLTRYIVWECKYPVPLQRSDMPVHEESNTIFDPLRRPAQWEDIKALLDSLYNRLFALLETERSQQNA
jgi:hypothetical protein